MSQIIVGQCAAPSARLAEAESAQRWNTQSDGNEDKGGPEALPGRRGELEVVEECAPHSWLVEGRVAQGVVDTYVLVKDGHGDHRLCSVDHIVHHDEDVAVHRLERSVIWRGWEGDGLGTADQSRGFQPVYSISLLG